MSRLSTDDLVGNYKILSKIGEGGMAEIYKAIQPALKRNVVVKKLKDPNREIIARFKKEALLSASFNHENLIAIYDFINSGKSYFLIMEHVDGEDLRTIIDYMSPLPVQVAALISYEIARGLQYTHSQNIIHTDIKPSNILISYDGSIKLIDFGVAKDDTATRLTMTGLIVGTPAYMSPEQANGEPLNAQSDIYSLGILLYEMLTGVKPFHGENNTEILAKIVRSKYTPPERINPAVPYRLRRIIKKALRTNRKKRYKSAAELIHDLERFIPWQKRSHKKELLGRFLNQLNKNEPPSTDDTVKFAMLARSHSKIWSALRYFIITAVLYLMVQLYYQFYVNELGFIKLEGVQNNVEIRLDKSRYNNSGDSAPVLGPVLVGYHDLEINDAANNSIFIARIPVTANDTFRVEIQTQKSNMVRRLNIVSNPDNAELSIDGHPWNVTPTRSIQLKPGFHTIEIRKDGYIPINDKRFLQQAESYTLHYTLLKK